ncbi:MAG: hypothetical protein JWR66_4125 [Modestobacter sp.]|jgi:hypothetical protein|nr:hypothetical protein [Modestobacter sp.]
MTSAASPTAVAPAHPAPHRRGRPGGPHQRAAQRVVAANATHLDFHLGDTAVEITLPPPHKLAFYAGLASAAALGVVEWPIALVTALGHLLSDDQHNRTLRALGEALDAV